MEAFFSAENLNCSLMQMPWKRPKTCSCLVMWFKENLRVTNSMHFFGSIPRDCLDLYGNVKTPADHQVVSSQNILILP